MTKNKFGKYLIISVILLAIITALYIGNKTGALSTIGTQQIDLKVNNDFVDSKNIQGYITEEQYMDCDWVYSYCRDKDLDCTQSLYVRFNEEDCNVDDRSCTKICIDDDNDFGNECADKLLQTCQPIQNTISFECPGNPTATPIPFNSYICVNDDTSAYACQGGGYACETKDTIPYYNYYCDFNKDESFVKCQTGCDVTTGLCKEGFRECSEGFRKCDDNNVLVCNNGVWKQQELCGDLSCVERSATYANCEEETRYCINNNFECIKSSSNLELCFDSLEECNNGIPLWCYTDNSCILRYGECQDGELYVKSTDPLVAEQTCKEKVSCSSDSSCDDGYICVSGKCSLGERSCTPILSYDGLTIIPSFGSRDATFLEGLIGKDKVSCISSIGMIMFLIGIIALISLPTFTYQMAKKQFNKTSAVISLILSFIVAFGLYIWIINFLATTLVTLIIIGVVLLIIYGLIRLFFKI